VNKLHKAYQNMMDHCDEEVEWFIDQLPHGSGIDCKWEVHSTGNSQYVYLCNSFHVMSDVGFYIGYADFRIRIDKGDFIHLVNTIARYERSYPSVRYYVISELSEILKTISGNFTLQFTGDRHLAEYYDLREYLTDTVWHAFYFHIPDSL
jgi:hypothetical protein